MKIYDCFMYYDEDLVLEVRLNTINDFVDYFVIVESRYAHNGEPRELNFKINNFIKFKDKIRYIVLENPPHDLISDRIKYNAGELKILNAIKRENLQRNYIKKGLFDAQDEDLIIVSDLDEIPNLSHIVLSNIKNKIIYIFKQKFFYYKFNLENVNHTWHGSKMCKFSFLKSPQWLRNVKSKKYNFWRIDTIFSKKKYQSIEFIENGGWHFTYLKTPELIQKKLKTYLHHQEYDENPMTIEQIKKLVSNKKVIYDHTLDQRVQNKFDTGVQLEKAPLSILPIYIRNNLTKFQEWLSI